MIRNLWIILFSGVFICGLTGIIKAEWITTELTVYTPYECPNEHTASGTIPTEGRTIRATGCHSEQEYRYTDTGIPWKTGAAWKA